MALDRSLDKRQRVLAWRVLHGKLRFVAFGCAGRAWHASSARLPARVLQWGASHTHSHLRDCYSGSWGGVLGVCHLGRGCTATHSAYLFLADDRRAWAPSKTLQGL